MNILNHAKIWYNALSNMADEQREMRGVDFIMRTLSDYMSAGEFVFVDKLLEIGDPELIKNTHHLICILTCSRWCKDSYVPNRTAFFYRCEKYFNSIGRNEPNLFIGLRPEDGSCEDSPTGKLGLAIAGITIPERDLSDLVESPLVYIHQEGGYVPAIGIRVRFKPKVSEHEMFLTAWTGQVVNVGPERKSDAVFVVYLNGETIGEIYHWRDVLCWQQVCEQCDGMGHIPRGCCTPDGPEYWEQCDKCNPIEYND